MYTWHGPRVAGGPCLTGQARAWLVGIELLARPLCGLLWAKCSWRPCVGDGAGPYVATCGRSFGVCPARGRGPGLRVDGRGLCGLRHFVANGPWPYFGAGVSCVGRLCACCVMCRALARVRGQATCSKRRPPSRGWRPTGCGYLSVFGPLPPVGFLCEIQTTCRKQARVFEHHLGNRECGGWVCLRGSI